jgi:hypothetical protein
MRLVELPGLLDCRGFAQCLEDDLHKRMVLGITALSSLRVLIGGEVCDLDVGLR